MPNRKAPGALEIAARGPRSPCDSLATQVLPVSRLQCKGLPPAFEKRGEGEACGFWSP